LVFAVAKTVLPLTAASAAVQPSATSETVRMS
jgi:hypothetical protein